MPSQSTFTGTTSIAQNEYEQDAGTVHGTLTDRRVSAAPLSLLKSFRPYYSPTELHYLVRLNSLASSSSRSATINPQTGRKELSEQRVESSRQLACGYIERVGNRLGFPRRTIATAQTLWHRFHLHYQLKDFPYQDVSLSAILVAAKVEDTLKKLRDIQIAGYQVLNIMEGGQGTGEGDSIAQEAHRPNLIAIERLVLQTICFNFHLHRSLPPTSSSIIPTELLALTEASTLPSRDVFTYTIRFCRSLATSKTFAYLAHLIAIDLHRTLAPLAYPPHTCAVVSIYLASFLYRGHSNASGWLHSGEEMPNGDTVQGPELKGGWVEDFESSEDDVRAIALDLLDLFISLCPLPAPESAFGGGSGLFSGGTPNNFSPISVLASPVDPAPPTPSSKSTKTLEREKHLIQTGIPHTLAMGWGGYVVDEQGRSVFAVRTVEDFTKIKIRLRELAGQQHQQQQQETEHEQQSTTASPNGSSKRARSTEADENTAPKKQSRRSQDDPQRWVGAQAGLIEIEEKRQEIEEKEQERALSREEREKGTSLHQDKQKQGREEGSAAGVRQNSKPKPSSVLYKF